MAQRVKDLVSLQQLGQLWWLEFYPRLINFHMAQVRPK